MNEKDYIQYLLNLPPEEIINWYKAKGYTFSWKWQDTWQAAHARSFTVAKAMKLDILKAIKQEVDKIFTDGISFEQFQQDLEPTLKRLGWWGKVKAKDVPGYVPSPDIDPEKIVELGSPRRLRTIYTVNTNVAYGAGRWNSFVANAKSRPLLQYHQIDRKTKRKSHTPFDKKVFYWNDPIWKIIAPPSAWLCGCYLTAHTLEEAKQKGWKISKGSDFMEIAKSNVPEEWQYNPGETYPAWDNVESNYIVSPGQKTFADYNRLKAKEIPEHFREDSPDKFPSIKEIGRDAFVELLKKEFGLQERDFNLINTADDDKILVTIQKLNHLIEKQDGRERYIPYLKETLKNPYEIYLTEYQDASDPKFKELRKTYFGFFNDVAENEDIFVSARVLGDSTILWNLFRREKTKIDRLRVGSLLFRK